MENELSAAEATNILTVLKERFFNHLERHPNMEWEAIEAKLKEQPAKLWTLNEMEKTGGEPDVIGDAYVFMDCAVESPKGRRSVCYDRPALEARKKNKPQNDAQSLAAAIGIELLTEEEYRLLQSYGAFDLKSSSWVQTPDSIRTLGGALFCDRRYDTVFTYHNGAEAYYGARGFRGKLNIQEV